MIFEWSPPGGGRNFGDALGSRLLPGEIHEQFSQNTSFMVCPIGSVINNEVMRHSQYLSMIPVFISCGWDGSDLDHDLVRSAIFFGARGPLTKAELAKHGMRVEISGDPAMGISSVISIHERHGRNLLIPHIADPAASADAKNTDLGQYLTPSITSIDELDDLVRLIGGSEFVLCGAMHAAIVAHSYGVPFAPYRSQTSQFVDHPLKWSDWLASVGIMSANFASTPTQGRNWWLKHGTPQISASRNERETYAKLLAQCSSLINESI